MTPIETERLVIRNWEDRDRDLFHEINSDPDIMRFFPFRRNRAESDAFLERLRADIAARGMGFTALELKGEGRAIGFAGLHRDGVAGMPPGTVEIGWRLARAFWGKGYVTEAGRALLKWGFDDLGLAEIVSFAVHDNHRSTAVMERLGMRRDSERDFDHPGVPPERPDLKRHVFYALSRSRWDGMQKRM